MSGSALVSGPSAADGGLPPASGGSDSEEGPGLGRRGRILVVEDEYLVALSSEWALTDGGFEVVAVVSSGEDALARAAEVVPDLVLMDIRLAGAMDGIEAARALRANGIPSIFASANSDPGTVERGETAEPLGWLRKPFSDAALIAAVEAALARWRGS